MKKVILSTLMLFVAVMMSAATYSWQNVVEVKLTDGNNDTYTSRFGAAPELTDAASWGAVTANMEGATVLAYTTLGNTNYEQLYLNSIENLPLTIKTYNSTDLAIELKALYGEIKLYDHGDLVLTVKKGSDVESDTYHCAVDVNSTIEDRFVINYQAAPAYAAEVTTNAYGLATFSNDQNLVPVEANVKLYKGTFSSLNDNLGLQEVSAVDNGQGVIVYGEANTTYHFEASADECGEFDGNDLKASSMWESRGNGYIYVLSGDALYLYEGTAFPANKAFLEVPASNGAPRRIGFAFDNATAIDNVEAEAVKAEKFIVNGQLFIRRGNEVFNLQGQIVK
jgi:hypothetical protein